MLCVNFFKRNLSFFILAIKNQLEYRINFISDALAQPIITAWIEIILWQAVFFGLGRTEINGFNEQNYLAYALWAAFISRISSNWMYEFRMIEEIETGSINALLVKPFSYFEYYFFQFFGYKTLTTVISLSIPIALSYYFNFPLIPQRIILSLGLVFLYLAFLYTLSFLVVTTAFHLTRVSSLTVAKNLGLWVFSGELLPLDLLPPSLYKVFELLPFSSGVYIPVGYLIGRVDENLLLKGYISTSVSTLVIGAIAWYYWKISLKKYSGTAA